MSYFPIFIDMTNRQVLVVGAGSVASRRVGVLEKFGAAITVIAPNTSEEIRKLADSRKIRLIEQTYEEVRDTIWRLRQRSVRILAAERIFRLESLQARKCWMRIRRWQQEERVWCF